MYFVNLIKEICNKNNNKKIAMFVDMDGVLADLDIRAANDIRNKVGGVFLNKRPLFYIINMLEELGNVSNLDLFILSACYNVAQANEKRRWLDKNASYFKENNRYFVIKEIDNYKDEEKNYMKGRYIKKIMAEQNYDYAFYIDDNYHMLKGAENILGDCVRCFHISSLLD